MVKLDEVFHFDGKPAYVVGLNYLSAEFGHNPDLWEQDDETLAAIADPDFQLMKDWGIMALRIQPAIFHKKKSFDNILKYARKYGIYIFPNFNLGDLMKGAEGRWFMSQAGSDVIPGESGTAAPPKFLSERLDPFDETSIANAKDYLKGLLSQYKDEEMILAWDIVNEPTYSMYGLSAHKYAQYYGGRDARRAREVTSHWAREICQAAREADPNHPITIGTDHSIVLMETGFDMVEFSKANDLMTTHHYSKNLSGYMLLEEICSLRDTYITAFMAAFSRVTGKPFASGECGNNSYVISEENQALSHRIMFYTGLANGAIGIFPWSLHQLNWDIPRIHQRYDSCPAESNFGLVRPDHTFKPAVEELAAFAQVVKKVDFSQYRFAKGETALLLPEYYHDFLYEHRASFFNAFVLAKQAHLHLEMRPACDGLEGLKILLVPTTHLTVREMDALREFVAAGGTLLLSVTDCGGRISYLRDLAGFILTDHVLLPKEVEVTFTADLGPVKKGDTLNYEADTLGWYVSHEKPEYERQYYTIAQPTTAEVVAVDGRGRPALLLNRFGKGQVLSFTFPAEYCLGNMPDVYETDQTHKVYEALAGLAGLQRQVDCDSTAVELGVLEGKSGRLIIAINHTTAPVKTTLQFARRPARVTDFICGEELKPGKEGLPLSLPASGVAMLQVEDAGK